MNKWYVLQNSRKMLKIDFSVANYIYCVWVSVYMYAWGCVDFVGYMVYIKCVKCTFENITNDQSLIICLQ